MFVSSVSNSKIWIIYLQPFKIIILYHTPFEFQNYASLISVWPLVRYEEKRMSRVKIVHTASRIASRVVANYKPYIEFKSGPLSVCSVSNVIIAGFLLFLFCSQFQSFGFYFSGLMLAECVNNTSRNSCGSSCFAVDFSSFHWLDDWRSWVRLRHRISCDYNNLSSFHVWLYS